MKATLLLKHNLARACAREDGACVAVGVFASRIGPRSARGAETGGPCASLLRLGYGANSFA